MFQSKVVKTGLPVVIVVLSLLIVATQTTFAGPRDTPPDEGPGVICEDYYGDWAGWESRIAELEQEYTIISTEYTIDDDGMVSGTITYVEE
ncbi:MAG: hypothetical protein DRO11_02665 [Methanobacteriota archaeon]|nr:MAG: hypothetical protein DRO11_02665 [Euryarchaeota archaeon]